MDYLSIKGHDETVDTTVITELAHFMQKEIGIQLTGRYPFVGRDFNVTRAGIHADGVLKNEEIYNIFDTDKLLNRPLKVNITDKSGVAGIAHWINTHLEPKKDITKKNPFVTKIYKWTQEQYDNGRTTAISDEEMRKITRRYFPELFKTELQKIEEKSLGVAINMVESLADHKEIMSMDETRITKLLADLIENEKYIQMAYVTDASGVQITENIAQPWIEKAKNLSKKGDDRTNRPWFTGVLKDGDTHSTGYYISQTTEQLCFTVSTGITNENDEFVGVLAMDFNFSYVASAVEDDDNVL